MRSIISALSIAFTLFIFSFYIDGDIGVILIAFMVFAPLISLFFALYGRKRVKLSIDCEGYVKKKSKLTVKVTVEKTGFFPLGVIEIHPKAGEVFGKSDKCYRVSLITGDKKTFTYELDANTGGNGSVYIESAYSCGFLGFMRFKLLCELPPERSVGVIPEIPDVTSASKLFRNIADSVMTSDDEENNDTALLYSANTAPGYEHREYEQGDPLKRINWKLSVKKDKLMVRLDEAVASVQPVIAFDLFRSADAKAEEAVINEEKLISAVFGLLVLLIKQGIACTFVYYGAGGEILSESVDNPDYPPQLLLKVLAVKVERDRRLELRDVSACSCIVASTDFTASIAPMLKAVTDKDSLSLIGISPDAANDTEHRLWYLDGDNTFKMV